MKLTYSIVTYSDHKVSYSDLEVTHSDPKHLPLPPPTPSEPHVAISYVKLNLRVGGGWKVATNFSVSSRLGFKL